MPRIWSLSGLPGPKEMAAAYENIAEVAIAIATPGECDLGCNPPIAPGDTPGLTDGPPVCFGYFPTPCNPT